MKCWLAPLSLCSSNLPSTLSSKFQPLGENIFMCLEYGRTAFLWHQSELIGIWRRVILSIEVSYATADCVVMVFPLLPGGDHSSKSGNDTKALQYATATTTWNAVPVFCMFLGWVLGPWSVQLRSSWKQIFMKHTRIQKTQEILLFLQLPLVLKPIKKKKGQQLHMLCGNMQFRNV